MTFSRTFSSLSSPLESKLLNCFMLLPVFFSLYLQFASVYKLPGPLVVMTTIPFTQTKRLMGEVYLCEGSALGNWDNGEGQPRWVGPTIILAQPTGVEDRTTTVRRLLFGAILLAFASTHPLMLPATPSLEPDFLHCVLHPFLSMLPL